MKILLVAPSESHIYGNFTAPSYPPLALSYLGAVLEKAGHVVKILDIDADKIKDEDFVRDLKNENYGLAGITTTTPTLKKSVHLTRLAKKYSNAYTVLGGVHVSVMPEETMKFPSVDFVVIGEGERTIIELVSCIENNLSPESVDGICYKKNGKILKTKERELISNLDEIPFPARHLYKSQNYSYPDTLISPTSPIFTSRGCPSSCTYCASNRVFKKKFRARSPKNTVDEIELLVKKFKAKEIHIWDDNFIFLKPRVIEIKEEIKKRNIQAKFAFPNGMRVDCVDEDILEALKEMGTYSIAFGVESGSQETLNKIKKGIKLKRIEEVFKLTKKFGIETWAFFIIGLPGENENRIKETIEFAIKINPEVAKFHILKPFPGTEVFDELSRDSLILNHDFDNYGIHTPPVHRLKTLSSEEILDWRKKAYTSFYLRPKKIVQQFLRIRTPHRFVVNFRAGTGLVKTILSKKEVAKSFNRTNRWARTQ